MTELDLIDALAAKLQETFRGITMNGKGNVPHPVRVFKQYIPQPEGIIASSSQTGLKAYGESDYDMNFPCVIIKHMSHTDTEEKRFDQSRTNIRLLFGTYDIAPECQGYRDILNMIDITRYELLTARVVGKSFMLDMPVTSKLLENDTWPVYFGEMNLLFTTGRPVMGKDFALKEALR